MRISEHFALGYIARYPDGEVMKYITEDHFYSDSIHRAKTFDTKEKAKKHREWMITYNPMFNQSEVRTIRISTEVKLLSS